ncbi:MAG TPA: hypothetical protein VFZ59_09745 [Verrucomicrobiae bacterium]|nr:hypothetical protein [Verrucomicrobiae bacterium]
MCISFDIDGTLIVPGTSIENGILPASLQRQLVWPLRPGMRPLARQLRRHGYKIWIYTSSGRSLLQIRLWLLTYGIAVDGVVNDQLHREALASHSFDRLPSKYPPAFGIDLHVDDSEGVRMEGNEHGFRVVVVSPDDKNWIDKVLAAAATTTDK